MNKLSMQDELQTIHEKLLDIKRALEKFSIELYTKFESIRYALVLDV